MPVGGILSARGGDSKCQRGGGGGDSKCQRGGILSALGT